MCVSGEEEKENIQIKQQKYYLSYVINCCK